MLHGTLTDQSSFLERFKTEARVVARLMHPNIALIYNFIQEGTDHFMVMEYVEGKNLDDLLKANGRLPAEIAIPIVLQALEGLDHAHQKSIFHRDIKPANIMLTAAGTVKLMDFGIARIAGEQRLTQVNRVIGTMEYMAPELILGKEPSAASDIYAMGVTLYEVLSGQVPFEGGTDLRMMQDIVKKKALAPDKLNSSVPTALSRIVMKAMEKKPENRFASAREFLQALQKQFPQNQQVDPVWLSRNRKGAMLPETQIYSQPQSLQDTMTRELQADSPIKRTGTAHSLQHAFRGRKRSIVLGLLALLILAALGFTFLRPARSEMQAASAQASDSLDKKTVSSDANSIPQEIVMNEKAVLQQPVPEAEPIQYPEPATVPVSEKRKTQPQQKESNRFQQEQTTPPEKTEQVPEQPDEPKSTAEAIQKPKSTREVNIRGRVNVPLRIQNNPGADDLREGQSIIFLVTEPVYYEGDLIIPRGAKAYGSVKGIGSVFISLLVDKIEAVNGQTILLKRTGITDRKKKLEEAAVYQVSLGRGVTLRL